MYEAFVQRTRIGRIWPVTTPSPTDSVWLRAAKKPRSEPGLTRDAVVSAAVELMDEGGVAALSMRKLAARLNSAPMTLYTYVDTKADILEFALDGVFTEMLTAAVRSDWWEDDLTAMAQEMFEVFLRHPWAPALLGSKPPIGPAAVAHLGMILEVLSDAGLGDGDLESALAAYYYYVLGAATAETVWMQAGRPLSTIADDELLSALTSADGRDTAPVIDFYRASPPTEPGRRFLLGLRRIIDGLRPIAAGGHNSVAVDSPRH